MNIAIKERQREDSDEIAPVTTDDACSFLATMKGGADAVFSVSRIALGNGNHITFDVYGTEGALRFDLDHDDRITVTRRNHEGRNSSVETVQISESFRAGQQQTFINLLHGIRDPYLPTLRDGLRMQRVLDALMTSAETRAWVDVV
jgi:predicted dehydrogenase